MGEYKYCYYGERGRSYDNDDNFWEDDDEMDASNWFASDDDESNDGGRGDDGANVNHSNVHLADVIDHVPMYPNIKNSHPNQRFRYYIHYRDFNRRMDEWITIERIISPHPSATQRCMR